MDYVTKTYFPQLEEERKGRESLGLYVDSQPCPPHLLHDCKAWEAARDILEYSPYSAVISFSFKIVLTLTTWLYFIQCSIKPVKWITIFLSYTELSFPSL